MSIYKDLEVKSGNIRLDLLTMFSHGKAHHFGGSFSCVELLVAIYYYKMNYSKQNWNAPDRDRCIMSKGHSVPTQYAILSDLGIIPRSDLFSIKRLGSRLQGHPDMRKTPGIEAPTGSLGQGLSFANGIALGARHDKLDISLYVVLGDGEMQEGQVWEAAMSTAHFGLGNITAIVDSNKYQSQGSIEEIMDIEPLEEKFRSFGWNTARVDGNDITAVCDALDRLTADTDRPGALIADTVKGKGISFIENTYKFHNYSLTEEEYVRAEQEIQSAIAALTEGVSE